MNILRGIIYSLILHLILVLSVYYFPQSWISPQEQRSQLIIEKKRPLEFDLLSDKTRQQVVRSTVVPDSQIDKQSRDKARFLSANNQRVLLETKAKLSGQTSNNFSTPKYQQELIEKKLAKIQKELESIKSLPRPEDVTKTELETLNRHKRSEYQPLELYPKQQYGVSTLGESLPDDVSIGDFTALNTDQFQFYTFYSRIEDLVRFRWESKIREAIELLDRQQILRNMGQSEWISQVEFLIDAQGFLKKAIILRESGIAKFDHSAILAFEDAKVFPNPPKEMLGPDGFIHLRYAFHVNYRPTYLAK